MKEYNLQEVINNIEDGEEYKSDSPLWEIKSIKKVNGNINFIYNGIKTDSVGVNASQRFIKVETPVSFMEVINSNKKGRLEHELVKDRFDNYELWINIMKVLVCEFSQNQVKDIIENGRWFLEEN